MISRIGRRWNIDPRPMSGVSEYAAFNNCPIWFNDPLGDTLGVDIMTDEKTRSVNTFNYYDDALHDDQGKAYTPAKGSFGESVLSTLNKISNTSQQGKYIVDELAKMKTLLPIREGPISAHQNGILYLNVSSEVITPTTDGNKPSPVFITAGHELAHAYSHLFSPGATLDRGPQNKWFQIPVENPDNPEVPKYRDISKDEIFASFIENKIRSSNSLPLRTHYSLNNDGSVVRESSLTSNTAIQFLSNNLSAFNSNYALWNIQQVHQRIKSPVPAK